MHETPYYVFQEIHWTFQSKLITKWDATHWKSRLELMLNWRIINGFNCTFKNYDIKFLLVTENAGHALLDLQFYSFHKLYRHLHICICRQICNEFNYWMKTRKNKKFICKNYNIKVILLKILDKYFYILSK